MKKISKIIATNLLLSFVLTFVLADLHETTHCSTSQELTVIAFVKTAQESKYSQTPSLEKVSEQNGTAKSSPSHFHCNHSSCCVFMATAEGSVSHVLFSSKGQFSEISNFLGVSLHSLYRPPAV